MILIYLPLSTIIAWYTIPNTLFEIVLQKPFLWAGVMVFYSCVSVYIQEYLYRTFFFHRYESIFSKNTLLFINAIVFSLAHAMFHNSYILLLTFLGGLVFAFTFFKTKSLLIVSIEHAIYGCWLFTLGIGKDLAFPEA